MTTDKWEKSVKEALDKLDKPKWFEPLKTIKASFSGVQTDGDDIDSQIEMVLWDLVAVYINSDSLPLERLFQRRVSELECWTHRAVKKVANEPCFWNPLDSSFNDFKHGGGTVREYTAACAYPARDMIRKWAEAHCL